MTAVKLAVNAQFNRKLLPYPEFSQKISGKIKINSPYSYKRPNHSIEHINCKFNVNKPIPISKLEIINFYKGYITKKLETVVTTIKVISLESTNILELNSPENAIGKVADPEKSVRTSVNKTLTPFKQPTSHNT